MSEIRTVEEHFWWDLRNELSEGMPLGVRKVVNDEFTEVYLQEIDMDGTLEDEVVTSCSQMQGSLS